MQLFRERPRRVLGLWRVEETLREVVDIIEILQACVGRGPTELAKGTWISLHFNKVVVNSQQGEPIGMGIVIENCYERRRVKPDECYRKVV